MRLRPRFTFPTNDWSSVDRTGGPLDGILDELRYRRRDLWVERLQTIQPSDDNNVYFIGTTDLRHVVQIDTGPHGQPPFIIEADDRVHTSEPAGALDAIEARLGPPQ
ncbi:hypothetical protein [Dactylosporangium sp. CA-092794]|uniref:hypothetical protein n=1 Tax=Dactylosporangium sp. CA-092794 TaxID=3239929 RepID=UPI003D90700B